MLTWAALVNTVVLNYFRPTSGTGRKTRAEMDDAEHDIFTAHDASCLNTLLRQASRRLTRIYDEAVAPARLTASQTRLLWLVDRSAEDGEALALQDLAERLGVQVSALTHALRPLQRDGLIELRPDPRDRRSKHAALTAPGRARLADATARWAEVNRRVENAMGGDGAERLRDLACALLSDDFLAACRAELADGDRLAATG